MLWQRSYRLAKQKSGSEDVEAVEKREEWSTNVWAANLPAATAKMVAADGQNDVMNEESSYTVS